MKKNKAIGLGLCICMAVSVVCGGCAERGKTVKRNTVKLENGEITEDSVVIAVGDEGVRYSEVLNYSYLLKRQYEGNFSAQLWNYPLSEDQTIGGEAKQEIINMITQLKVIKSEAKKEDVTLSNDELDESIQKAESLMEKVSEEDKETYALSVQGFSEIYQDNILANKMFYIATDDADTEVSEELSDEEKEAEIQKRLTARFKEKYGQWLEQSEVRISEEFWDTFQL